MSVSTRVEVLLWAGRIIARKGAPPHELLDVKEDASLDQAQEAFHKLARIAHPDLHRTTLDAAELERVTTAYAYVAAAYQAIRIAKLRGLGGRPPGVPAEKPAVPVETPARIRRPSEPVGHVVRLPGGGLVRGNAPTRPPPVKVAAPQPAPPPAAKPVPAAVATAPEGTPVSASAAMNSKALVQYRKAEMALRQGDLRMATLHLKMAIASDPQSQFLRQAIAEVEAALKT